MNEKDRAREELCADGYAVFSIECPFDDRDALGELLLVPRDRGGDRYLEIMILDSNGSEAVVRLSKGNLDELSAGLTRFLLWSDAIPARPVTND